MTRLSKKDQTTLNALRRAVADALDRKRRLGEYAEIWRDGKVVRVESEQLAAEVQAARQAVES